MGGAVDQLEKLLIVEAVHDSEESRGRARRGKGSREIGTGQTGGEGFPRGCLRLALPTEEPADEEPDVQEGAHHRRGCERKRPGGPRSEEHTSELQSLRHLVCRLLL